jgi:signal transduction histidine kinase
MPLSKDPLTDSSYFRYDTYYPWLCLIAVIVGGLLTFLLPYSFHFSAREPNVSMTQYLKVLHPDSELTKAVETDQFKMALLLSVAIAIPITFDTILDCAYPIIHPEESLLWYSKSLLLISTTLPNFILLVGNFGPFLDDAFIISFYFTRIAVTGFSLAYTSQIALKYQMKEISTKCVKVVMLGVTAYALCSFSNFLIHPIDRIVNATASFIRLGAHLFFINAVVSWYRKAHPGGEAISYCEMIILVKLAAVFFCNNLIAGTAFYYNAYNDRNASSDCICRYIYIQMFYTVIVMTIPGRISRLELNYATRAMKERQAFIRYISHEIRTPLNTVFLGLEFVTSALKKIPTQRGDNSVQPVIDTVDDIYSSCEIAMSILNDLLTFDKMEGGKMNLELEYVNCCDYVGSLAKPFNVNARDKQIAFSLNLQDVSSDFQKNAYLKVDHSKMGQVVRNLISNALKFTPDGGTVTVAVSHMKINTAANGSLSSDSFDADKSGMWPFRGTSIPVQAVAGVRDVVRVEVRDTGAGISTINQTKLFGQYVQFNANKLQKGSGSGLGLWISKGITELHGGCIGAYSEGEGKGSTFYLELPVTFFNVDDSGRVYSRSNSTSGSAHCTPPSKRKMRPSKNRSSSTDLSEKTAYSGGDLDEVTTGTLTAGIYAHLCNKLDSMPNTPKSSATCTPYPASSPMVTGRHDARSEDLIRCGSCKSAEGSENYFSSGEDADADCDDDNNIEVISEADVENVKDEKFRIVMNHQLMEKLKKVRHAPPPYSGTSSISSQSSSKTESSSLFGLSELLKKSITGSGTESSSYARKDSIDFLSSAHPFMVTSIPFMQSINSSRGSLSSSKFQSRYPSISNTPRCASPRLANSDKSTPTATGQSTPYFNSPHVSPRGSGEMIEMR